MKDELFKKLIDYLGNFENFAASELPSLATDIVNYIFYFALFKLFFLVIISCVSVKWVMRHWEFLYKNQYEHGVIILGLPTLLLILFEIGRSVDILIKTSFAPKLFLLEYATSLLK